MTEKIFKNVCKATTLAILSQIPVASAFSTFTSEFINSQWQDRIELWQKEVIDKLSKQDETFEKLIKENNNFASIFATAQQYALTDVSDEKVKYYVEMLVNLIKSESADNVKIHIFLNILNTLTVLHLKVLEFLSKNQNYNYTINLNSFQMKSPETIAQEVISNLNSEIIKDIELFKVVLLQLHKENLIDSSKITAIYDIKTNNFTNQYHKTTKRTTKLGDEFLSYIKELV